MAPALIKAAMKTPETSAIHDYNVVFPECRNQIVLQVIHKLLPCSPSAVSRIVHVSAQANGRQDRRAFRSVQRHASDNAFSPFCSPICTGHVRIDSAFIQKEQVLDIKALYQRQMSPPNDMSFVFHPSGYRLLLLPAFVCLIKPITVG